MKKRLCTLLLTSLFSLATLIACGEPEENEDDMFDGDEDTPTEKFTFKDDTSSNYSYDTTVSNENGSMGYEIFVRSYYDSDGDGIGDLRGVAAKLDYLEDLGIKTVWLMPIHPSPTYHGYDVTDYYGVHPDYGTLDDFDYLITQATSHHIDIMLDMVFNHSSDRHPWFTTSLKDYAENNELETSKKDWYNWSHGSHYKEYNGTKYYYEGSFDSSMPDLNLSCEAVKDELENVTKFWIEHGVKGFRLDAVKHYFTAVSDNVSFLTWLEETAHKYDPNFYMVGEDWESNDRVLQYHQSKCDSFFKFSSSIEGSGNDAIVSLVKGNGNAQRFGDAIESYEASLKQANPNGYATYFLSNHDQDRVSKNTTETFAAPAINLLATLPGMSFIYYGEEILMKGERQNNDLSDARRRLPMVWSSSDKTGQCAFPETNRQDLATNAQVSDGVSEQLATPYSVLNAYRHAINIRNKYPIFKHGVFTNLTSQLNATNKNVLAYKITYGDQTLIFIHNFALVAVEVNPIGTRIVEQMNVTKKIPEIDSQGKLHIAGRSSVILEY